MFSMPKLLEIYSWTRETLYSACVLFSHPAPDRLFHYARSEVLPGAKQFATKAHTNLWRSGRAGLPQSWEFFVSSWRFTMNRPLTEELLDWASEISVEFIYNYKRYAQEPLVELLQGTRSISSDEPFGRPFSEEKLAAFLEKFQVPTTPLSLPAHWLPVWMRENLIFEVTLSGDSEVAEQAYQRLLDSLDGQRLVMWGHLDGYMKRPVQ